MAARLLPVLLSVGVLSGAPRSSLSDPQARLGTPSAAAFLGLEIDALEARLGSPDFTRIDPPAEFRRYQVGDCALDLILYPHPDKAGPIVAHAQYRRAGAGALPSGACGAQP